MFKVDPDSVAPILLTPILQIEYALSKTFKNIHMIEKEHRRAIQVVMAHWEYCPHLPRYGLRATWNDLNASDSDPHRPLTKEERVAVTDLAFQLLPQEVFLSLESHGIKKYKDELDERIRKGT